jgi:ribosome-binding factor A
MNIKQLKPKSQRQLKIEGEIIKIAQNFFQRESNGASIITVTEVDIAPNLENCLIKFRVLPDDKEKAALEFARRLRPELRNAIKDGMRIYKIPHLEVDIDYGDKNREHLDQVMKNI